MNVRVCGVIIENNSVLLIRHDYGDEQLWHIPGGNVKDHEILTDTLKREYLEELTLKIKPGELWLVCNSVRLPDQANILHCVFIAELLKGEPIIQHEATSGVEYAWVSIPELTSLKLYPHIVGSLQELILTYPYVPSVRYIGRCETT